MDMQTGTVMQQEAELGAAGEVQPAPNWRLVTRVVFRFAFSYFLLYNITTFIDILPFTDGVSDKYESLWQRLVPWIGSHVLYLSHPITIFTNGSGDTTYDYVKVFPQAVIAVIATVAWSVLDRRRPNYRALHQWFMLLLRIALGVTMVSYGAVKVIKSQFPDPSMARLMQRYGDSSPMGLLWTFMGASKTYTMFAGGVEVLGGLLLFIPRLTTLGALVSIGALANIFLLNMSYDVPVKLYSFHLLLMAAVLAAPDFGRLADFFVFHRKTQIPIYSPVLCRKWANWSLLAIQVLLIGYSSIISFVHAHQAFTTANAKPALYGIWSVDEYSLNGQPVAAGPTDRWNLFIVDSFTVSIASKDGGIDRYRSKIDATEEKMVLTKTGNASQPLTFSFSNPQADSMLLEGSVENGHINAKLHRIPAADFLLKTRGFHWINEYPFNR
jgi:uncharacterized membrane protein YphA (DoxX/SURF4 family)